MKKLLCSIARGWLGWQRRVLDRSCPPVRPSMVHGSKVSFHAGTVLLTACRIRNRVIKEDSDKRTKGEKLVMIPEATAVVVMAAAAAEAFINEIAETVSMQKQNTADWPEPMPMSPQLGAAADAVLDAEFRHANTQEKYTVAALALGQPFEKGRAPFQEFDRLFRLRDALMHVHPVRPKEQHDGEQMANELAARGIALKREPPGEFPWWDRVGTPGVARWACARAREMILAILDRVPDPLTPAHPVKFMRDLYHTHPGFEDETWGV